MANILAPIDIFSSMFQAKIKKPHSDPPLVKSLSERAESAVTVALDRLRDQRRLFENQLFLLEQELTKTNRAILAYEAAQKVFSDVDMSALQSALDAELTEEYNRVGGSSSPDPDLGEGANGQYVNPDREPLATR